MKIKSPIKALRVVSIIALAAIVPAESSLAMMGSPRDGYARPSQDVLAKIKSVEANWKEGKGVLLSKYGVIF